MGLEQVMTGEDKCIKCNGFVRWSDVYVAFECEGCGELSGDGSDEPPEGVEPVAEPTDG